MGMAIKKILICNLADRAEKRYFLYGAFANMRVPLNLIEFFKARDGRHYITDPPTIGMRRAVEAAAKEIEFVDHESCIHGMPACVWAWHWSWGVMLKQLSEELDNDSYAIVLPDDYYLGIPWSAFEDYLDKSKRGKWHPDIIFMDNWRYDPVYPDPTTGQSHKPFERERVLDTNLFYGYTGFGDCGQMVNGRGARRLYELNSTYPWYDPEYQFLLLGREADQEGIYSTGIDTQIFLHCRELDIFMGWSDRLQCYDPIDFIDSGVVNTNVVDTKHQRSTSKFSRLNKNRNRWRHS